MKVRVYSTPNCPFCKMVKDFLNEHNIPYEDIDVANDRAAAEEMIKKSGQMAVPVIEIDGEIVVGFDVEKLKKTLKLGGQGV